MCRDALPTRLKGQGPSLSENEAPVSLYIGAVPNTMALCGAVIHKVAARRNELSSGSTECQHVVKLFMVWPLSSIFLLDHRKSNAICYIFFDFNNGNKQTADSLLRTLVAQQCMNSEQFRYHLEGLHGKCMGGSSAPCTAALARIFESMIKFSDKV